LGGFLEVVLLRDVGDFQVSSLTGIVSDFSDVKAGPEVADSDVVNVVLMLVEGGSDFARVAIGAMDAIVPIAEVP
jgi:hypothetical protein